MAEMIEGRPKTSQNPEPNLYLGLGDPNGPDAQAYASFKFSDIPSLCAEDGPLLTQLGQQWVVFVFAEWENAIRRRLAEAHGCAVAAIQADIFGDLRLMRNDILHHGGIASTEESDRCKILRWFFPGDKVVITPQHIAEFMRSVPWNELRAKPQPGGSQGVRP